MSDSFSRRPCSRDTEDDILRDQEEFLKAKGTPSAKPVRLVKPGDKRKSPVGDKKEEQIGLPQKKSFLTEEMDVNSSDEGSSSDTCENIIDPEEELERQDQHITKILSDIVERDFDVCPISTEKSCSASGFPVACRRNDQAGVEHNTGNKKMSIFAQQFRQNINAVPLPLSTDTDGASSSDPLSGDVVKHWQSELGDPAETSTIDVGCADVDMREIDRENEQKLRSMDQREILEKQKELLEVLDPNIIAFLRSRHKNKQGDVVTRKRLDQKNVIDHSNVEMSTESDNLHHEHQLNTEDVGIPLRPRKEWVHMNTVEHDKLAWMKDLPPPSAGDNKTGKSARFDFEGHLVAADAEIPVHLGLHHHGLEPERAGYTLEELFQLSRSISIPQRCLALSVVGKVIVNAKHGEFHDCLSTGIVPSLLDGGLVFILRWALDDATENALVAAVDTMHSLLVCKDDEVAADTVFSWYQGCLMPCLRPVENDGDDGQVEDKEQETDADTVKKDIVKGLLRMSLLERLRYILEKCHPPAPTVVQIVEILIRIARHSLQSASEVFGCSRLLEILCKEFLPFTWNATDISKPLSDAYGYPLPVVMKLMRVIAAAGRHMAALMVSRYQLMDRIVRFIAQKPCDLVLNGDQAHDMCLESWHTWRLLMHYGCGAETFSGCYPVVIQWLPMVCTIDSKSTVSENQLASAVVGLVEAACNCCHANQKTASSQTCEKTSGTFSSHDHPSVPLVSWSQVSGLFEPIQSCIRRCLADFSERYFEQKYDLSFISCCLNCLATYFSNISCQPGYCAVDAQKLCEEWGELLVACLRSRAFSFTVQYVRNYSVYLYEGKSTGDTETAANLPCLGSLIGASHAHCPVLDQRASVQFVLAVSRLLVAIGRLSRAVADKVYSCLLDHEETLQYVHKICRENTSVFAANYFTKFENQLQFHLITMARMKGISDGNGTVDMGLYHLLALNLLTHLHPGDEHLAHDLLSNVIFSIDFLRDVRDENDSAASELDEVLHLQKRSPLTSATQQRIEVSPSKLVQDILTHISSLRATFLESSPIPLSAVIRSRHQVLCSSVDMDSLLSGPVGQLLVPLDWCFLPIVGLYSRALNMQMNDGMQENVPPALVAAVINTLRVVYLLERWRPSSLQAVSLVVKLSRLMCTFLAGSDLFLNMTVHWYLAELLHLYCKPVYLDRMDFKQAVPGLASFYDFYMLLLNQYEAVSFGDSLFACYILLPLQQQHSVALRKVVWGDRVTILRSLSIPIKELVIPLDRFLIPEETNVDLLQLYFQAIMSGSVTPRWSPLMYLISVHHLNRFIYTVDSVHQRLRHQMIRRIVVSEDEVIRRHLLFFKKAADDCELHMELYDVLPAIRLATLEAASKHLATK